MILIFTRDFLLNENFFRKANSIDDRNLLNIFCPERYTTTNQVPEGADGKIIWDWEIYQSCITESENSVSVDSHSRLQFQIY